MKEVVLSFQKVPLFENSYVLSRFHEMTRAKESHLFQFHKTDREDASTLHSSNVAPKMTLTEEDF